ncbi:hypothetical protein SynA18461_00399 [Synechococcus sp. A18-46.1]|nr:hypothetical protein SynA18461_00399 [Synechococcus sp. A18-46.1]
MLRLDNCKEQNLVMPHRPNDLSIYTLKNCSRQDIYGSFLGFES